VFKKFILIILLILMIGCVHPPIEHNPNIPESIEISET
jgi:TRAP-type C4-dicarboxylate transport system permease large subunit